MVGDTFDSAADIATELKDEILANYLKLCRIDLTAGYDLNLTDKDCKEVVNHFKKSQEVQGYIKSTLAFGRFYAGQDNPKKAFDVIFHLIKDGLKRIGENGMELVVGGMEGISVVMRAEVTRPGVNWIVDDVRTYFEKISEIILEIEEHLDSIGRELFNRFRNQYLNIEPVVHFNIYVYLRYQFWAIKVQRLNAVLQDDELSMKVLAQLIKEMEDDKNPVSFIKADWDEFKKVPNSVRNKVINKCITITKGDLPAAAEHLDFSYRNLRSYITFNEVNRLGWFLEERMTRNRKLEEGIRLMFHDLYKKGTIFEVVFDMPKFLVDFADNGFCSLDMETALDIKGTTAKKYIKIMMDIDLIDYEKSLGRKHFYRLRKDIVMNRLAKEVSVISTPI